MFNNNFVAIHEIKPVLILDKRGFSTLRLREFLTYDFHWSYVEAKSEDKAKLLLKDTESLV